MDCTVDSMFTTTPFFIPREGWWPTPMISTSPVGAISPTIANTLEVPISRPTINFASFFLDIIIPRDAGPPPYEPERIYQTRRKDSPIAPQTHWCSENPLV